MDIVWNDVFALILTGVVVVFFALGFLTLVVMAIGKIVTALQKNAPNAPKQTVVPEAEAEQVFSAEQTDVISPALVAVISAAVAMMEPNSSYRITKINQTQQSNAWRTAGVVQNTRSF